MTVTRLCNHHNFIIKLFFNINQHYKKKCCNKVYFPDHNDCTGVFNNNF